MLDVHAATLSWSPCATLNEARYYAAIASTPNGVFVFGGSTPNTYYSDTIEQLTDVAAVKWTALTARLKTGRNEFAAAVAGDRVLLIGGGAAGKTYLNTVEMFDTTTRCIVGCAAPISSGRNGLAAVSYTPK